MVTKVEKGRPADGAAAFRWGVVAAPGPELSRRPSAPVVSLLALTDVLVASHADGQLVVYPVRGDGEPILGVPWELCRFDPPAVAMVFCAGELVGAAGTRLVRVRPDGTTPEPIELDAPVGAIVARHGRVHAVAGDGIHTYRPVDDGWELLHRTPVRLSNCHDLDVDRHGRHAVVCERPDRGLVVELGTGTVVGRCGPSRSAARTITESYARFSPVSDYVYRASSRSHDLDKLPRLARSGRTVRGGYRLHQPSTWCTPLVSGPDGRYVASRQSGIGVLVWDLAEERAVLFAELDDTPKQEKFDKRARRTPVAARSAVPGAITITRWANVPEQDGEATAVAVAPGADYAVTGDRHGVVTAISRRTRRIEHGDGRVRQPGCLAGIVEVGEPRAWSFAPGEWIGVSADGVVTVVDLVTGRKHSPGSVDLTGVDRRPELLVEEDELLLVSGGRHVRAFDRSTLAPTWRVDDPLPDCGPLRYNGSELLAIERQGGLTRRVHRYRPRTGDMLAGPTLTMRRTDAETSEVVQSRRGGRYVVRVRPQRYGDGYWHRLLPTGELGSLLPGRTEILPASGHAVVGGVGGWAVFDLDDPELPPVAVDGLDVAIGALHLDPASGLVATADMHTRRIHVWTVEGKPVASFDGVGEALVKTFALVGDSLWLATNDDDVLLYQLTMPNR